jgi:hypothetical protein
MKTKIGPGRLITTLLCSLVVGGNVKADFSFSPAFQNQPLTTNGDVNLVNQTGPNTTVLPTSGFTVSRSYTLDATRNLGTGGASWRTNDNFDSTAVTPANVRINGSTNITFGTGTLVFTVNSFVIGQNGEGMLQGPMFQRTLTPADIGQVAWDVTAFVGNINQSAGAFDDTLALTSSVMWMGFNNGDRLTVDSEYTVTAQPAPEPSTWLLFGTGLLGLLGCGWRRGKKSV